MGKKKQVEIEELIEDNKKLKHDSNEMQKKVDHFCELLELRENKIALMQVELNKSVLESKKYEQLHRDSTVDVEKMKASIVGKQNEIIDLNEKISEKQQDIDESKKRNQQILSENEIEKSAIVKKSEETICQLQKHNLEKCGIIDKNEKIIYQLQKDLKELQI